MAAELKSVEADYATGLRGEREVNCCHYAGSTTGPARAGSARAT